MADNSDDIIQINGKLVLDMSSTDASIQKLIKSFQKLEQGPTQRLQKDLQAITSVAKGLDKELASVIQKFSKDTAKQNIIKINSAIKDQVGLLKESTKQVDSLSRALKGVDPGSGKYKELFQKLEQAQMKASSATAGIVQGSQEKNFNQRILDARLSTTLSGAGRAVELGGMAASFVGGHEMEMGYRRAGYRAQQAQPGQDFATMAAFNPLQAAFTLMGMKGMEGINAANDATKFRGTGKPLIEAATAIGGAGLSAAGEGLSAVGEGEGGGIKAATTKFAVAAVSETMKQIADKADFADPRIRAEAIGAIKGQTTGHVMQAGAVSTQFLETLTEEVLAKAQSRMSAGEAMFGAGGIRTAKAAMRKGIQFGMSQEETLSYQTMLGQTGMNAEQRTNLEPFLAAHRQGLGNAGQLIQQSGQFLGAVSNADDPKRMQDFIQAVRQGMSLAMENPRVGKALVQAALTAAQGASGKVNNLDFYMSQLGGALTGPDRGMKRATAQDVEQAQGGVDLINSMVGGKDPRSLQTNLYLAGKQFKGLDIGTKLVLSRAQNPEEILSDKTNANYQNLFSLFGNKTDEKVKQYFEQKQGGAGLTGSISLGKEFGAITGNAKSKKEFVDKLNRGDRDATSQYNKWISGVEGATGGTETFARGAVNRQLGFKTDNVNGKLTDLSKGSLERGLSNLQAGSESGRDALRGTPEILTKIQQAIQLSGKLQTQILDKKDGLPANIDNLTEAIEALTKAVMGKNWSPDSPQSKAINSYLDMIDKSRSDRANVPTTPAIITPR